MSAPDSGRTVQVLGYSSIQNKADDYLMPFLDACKYNDVATALSLAPGRDAGALTVGLNRALGANHLILASKLLEIGAQWDTWTVDRASRSLAAIQVLSQAGFDVNTRIIGGGMLLLLAVELNDASCIEYLLDRGADPRLGPPANFRAGRSRTHFVSNSGSALNLVAAYSSLEIFALLLAYGAEITRVIPVH